MPVFLVGFMATGKTTIGGLVARLMSRRFVDLDEEIEKATGKSVWQILDEDGETAFRKAEEEALVRAIGLRHVVVACGGGTPCYGNNLERMRRAGLVVTLWAPLEESLRRARASLARRPLLGNDRSGVEALFRARASFYRATDVAVDTCGRDAVVVAEEVARRASNHFGALFVSAGERSYPIHFCPLPGVGQLASDLLEADVVAVVSDAHVAKAGHLATVVGSLEGSGMRVIQTVIPPGEAQKNLANLERLAKQCVEGGLHRRGAVVAVGGGVVGDLTGFLAAVLFRGIPFAQVPTTLLAMVDSAVGGKTGVDLGAAKNMVGAFWQPRFVLIDLHTLETLPRRELLAAFGEIVKYALIGDAELLSMLERAGTEVDVAEVIRRCLERKAAVVAQDERDLVCMRSPEGDVSLGTGRTRFTLSRPNTAFGRDRDESAVFSSTSTSTSTSTSCKARAPRNGRCRSLNRYCGRAVLNLGHTVGHAIEAAASRAGNSLLHGEAVALGLVAAARISARLGLCKSSLQSRIVAVLERVGLDADLDRWLGDDSFADYLTFDKKRHGASIRFVGLEEVGCPCLVQLAPADLAGLLNRTGGKCYDCHSEERR
ncbi:MAG: bifunctional shikimate kinase/3-dehydroquinate synthase [Pseudomonadota bacterium]